MNNSGNRVKTIAIIMFAMGIVISLIAAVILFKTDMTFLGISVLLIGALASWCVYCFIDAFGDLVSNSFETNSLLRKAKKENQTTSTPITTSAFTPKEAPTKKTWICPKCGEENNPNARNCINCFTKKPE